MSKLMLLVLIVAVIILLKLITLLIARLLDKRPKFYGVIAVFSGASLYAGCRNGKSCYIVWSINGVLQLTAGYITKDGVRVMSNTTDIPVKKQISENIKDYPPYKPGKSLFLFEDLSNIGYAEVLSPDKLASDRYCWLYRNGG